MANKDVTLEALQKQIQNLQKQLDAQKSGGQPQTAADGRKYVYHDGRKYDVPENGKFQTRNPELALAAEEQLEGKTFTEEEREKRLSENQQRVRNGEDVLIVTDSARSQVRVVSALRDRSAETLQPQPGPIVQMVNGDPISAKVPALNETTDANDFDLTHPDAVPQTPAPQLNNEAVRLGHGGSSNPQSEKKGDKPAGRGSQSKADEPKSSAEKEAEVLKEQDQGNKSSENPEASK